MKPDKLYEAMGKIDDRYLLESESLGRENAPAGTEAQNAGYGMTGAPRTNSRVSDIQGEKIMKKKGGFSNLPGAAKGLIALVAVLVAGLVGLLAAQSKLRSGSSSGNVNYTAEAVAESAKDASADGMAEDMEEAAPAEDTGETDAVVEEGIASAGGITVEALERPQFIPLVASQAAVQENVDKQLIGSEPIASTTPLIPAYEVEPDLSNVENIGYDNIYVTDEQAAMLAKNGFVVTVGAGGDEFFDLYEMNRYNKVPNFVTVDSMMHTYHLYFMHLMKNTERNYLSGKLGDLSAAMLQKSIANYEALTGTEWEDAAKAVVLYYAVGNSLITGGASEIPDFVANEAATELDNIMNVQNLADSPLLALLGSDMPLEDYSQYIVRGYYEGDETLEKYFRAMMWYGRVNFAQRQETADRAALLVTLETDAETQPSWESIYQITSFFAGASDDCGYYEYRPIIDAVYGADVTAAGLAGRDQEWASYHALTAEMKAPKINSVVVADEGTGADHEEEEKGFRFMGQRFTIDGAIMQNLVYNKVGTQDTPRALPNALDVPAALGSDTALSILEELGETVYANYMENMNAMRAELSASDDSMWNASLYSQWLNTLLPVLQEKGEGYPEFMQNEEWNRKNLQTFLGSYTELKHDTVLYAKQIMVEMGGGPEEEVDDSGYVEPEPEVYARLAALSKATVDGLASYGLLSAEDEQNMLLLADLASKLQAIAEKELRNETPTEEEFELIRSFGGQIEHFWEEVYKDEPTGDGYMTSRTFPAPLVTDIATNADRGTVLEIATGQISEVLAIAPVKGQLRLVSGGVYSFYQFEQPMGERLTDTKWRQMMGYELNDGSYEYDSSQKKPVEDWTRGFQIEYSYY